MSELQNQTSSFSPCLLGCLFMMHVRLDVKTKKNKTKNQTIHSGFWDLEIISLFSDYARKGMAEEMRWIQASS